MKKFISIIIFSALATAAFAQYPLPDTRVIGTLRVDSGLTVIDTLKFVDGNESNGYVLTSDADGYASWQAGATDTQNTLDQAYDEGGAGAGRTITADNGAVAITGNFRADNTDFDFQNDTVVFLGNNIPIAGASKEQGSGLWLNALGDFSGVGGSNPALWSGFVSAGTQSLFKIDSTQIKGFAQLADTNSTFFMYGQPNNADQVFLLQGSIGKGNSGFEAQIEGTGELAAKMYAASFDGGSNISVIKADTNSITIQTDTNDVQLYLDYDEVSINTTQALFYPPRMTSTQASALTPADGATVYVTDTDGTFTSVGFWGYVNGTWEKLD